MPDRLNILVPVHRGAAALPATLRALAAEANARVTVSIVVNGPDDRALEIAGPEIAMIRAAGAEVALLEIAAASRIAALNAADTRAGHRMVLDQDAVLGPGTLAAVCGALDHGVDYATGRAFWRTGSTAVGRAMALWSALPYVRDSPVAAGMYAVSARGRARWGDWPDELPDDKFARLHFESSERARPGGASYSVDAPGSFAALVAHRRRYAVYNRALRRIAPELMRRDLPRTHRAREILGQPSLWVGAALFTAAEVAARGGR